MPSQEGDALQSVFTRWARLQSIAYKYQNVLYEESGDWRTAKGETAQVLTTVTYSVTCTCKEGNGYIYYVFISSL